MPRPLETVATQVVANEAESIANEGESVEVPMNTNPNMAVKTSSKKSNKRLPASILIFANCKGWTDQNLLHVRWMVRESFGILDAHMHG